MTLRQLEYFIAVIESRSFTRAAQRLMVSQPTLSHQLRELERSVGSALVIRPPGVVGPTEKGRAFRPHAEAVLRNARAAEEAARSVGNIDSGDLQVATLYSIAVGIVPAAIRAFRVAHPGVRVEILEYGHPQTLVTEMSRGVADIGVGPVPPTWSGRTWSLGDEEFVLVLPAGDPLLSDRSGEVALTRLAQRPWVLYADDHGLSEVVSRACGAAGFRPLPSVRTHHTSSAIALASAGLGPSLAPANVVGPEFAACAVRASPPVRRTISAFTRAEPDRLSTAFIAVLALHATL